MSIQASPTQIVSRNAAWLLVGLVILFAVVVRMRLRETPLERDEGEYAYAGQLMLEGIPPYKLAYNLKLPGTYAAYALILAVFGQTASAVHTGLAIVNAICIALMFLLARRMLDDAGAVTAAGVFALMSLCPSVLGLAAHATHFVVLFALGGTLLLVRACEPATGAASTQPPGRAESRPGVGGNRLRLFISGIVFGLAVLMKQHGILFAMCGAIYLIWARRDQGAEARARNLERRRSRSEAGHPKGGLTLIATDLAILTAGGVLPYLIMCLILAAGGVFHEFWFWTFTYARKYVSSVPMAEGPANLRQTMGVIFSDNPYFWISLGLGAIVMWWDEQLSASSRFLITIFTLCSAVAVSAGLYFREHYFIMLLPAVALLNGVAVSRSLRLLRHDKTIELFLTVPILLLVLVGFGAALVTFGWLWFATAPSEASARIYGSTLFDDAKKAAEIIKARTPKDARIAVLGSEPEIYFYAHRRSVTGFIYTYPLMETHDYALKMQEQMIHDIEDRKPDYVVFVNAEMSWLTHGGSERKIFSWWDNYWTAHYDLEESFQVLEDVRGSPDTAIGLSEAPKSGSSFLLVLKRK